MRLGAQDFLPKKTCWVNLDAYFRQGYRDEKYVTHSCFSKQGLLATRRSPSCIFSLVSPILVAPSQSLVCALAFALPSTDIYSVRAAARRNESRNPRISKSWTLILKSLGLGFGSILFRDCFQDFFERLPPLRIQTTYDIILVVSYHTYHIILVTVGHKQVVTMYEYCVYVRSTAVHLHCTIHTTLSTAAVAMYQV